MNKPATITWTALIASLVALPALAGQLGFLDQEHSAPATELSALQRNSDAEVRVNGNLEDDNAGLELRMRSSIARLQPGDLLLEDMRIRDVAPMEADLDELADLDIDQAPDGEDILAQESASLTAPGSSSTWSRFFQ
jgi:hypothetical protein